MGYRQLKGFGEEEFRRLTGIHHSTFRQMAQYLKLEEAKKLGRSLVADWSSADSCFLTFYFRTTPCGCCGVNSVGNAGRA